MNEMELWEAQVEYKVEPDIDENNILNADTLLLDTLLKDKSTEKNILWMTDNYSHLGQGYEESSEITVPLITGKHAHLIKPRINKTKKEQLHRVRDKAEVFTPSWICNCQNNLIDNAWFGWDSVFNFETEHSWKTATEKIAFPEGKTWMDYVLAQRMEISCGEAPYLFSRYDTTTGEMLEVKNRIGILDRKLRIISENTRTQGSWINWSIKAVQSIYGYEWQGDSLLLARENAILDYIDTYKERFDGKKPSIQLLRELGEILAWNLWQMDGIKYVVPKSCHDSIVVEEGLFESSTIVIPCEGCQKDNVHKHNGIYCHIMDWQKDEVITAVSMLKG
jgi:hypothetical protein